MTNDDKLYTPVFYQKDMITEASQLQANPFVVLTFIVAPAILTNASALMILSTSNRFARAIDRGRDLSRQVEEARNENNLKLLDRLYAELLLTEKRAIILLKAIRSFYFSLGGFALGALVSLLGAGLVSINYNAANRIFAISAVVAVFLAVAGLVTGSTLLFYESRITVHILQDRIKRLHRDRQL